MNIIRKMEILGPLDIYGMVKDSNIIFRVSEFLPNDGKRFFTRKTVLTKIVFAGKNSFCHLNLSRRCINLTPHFLLLRYVVNSFTYFLKKIYFMTTVVALMLILMNSGRIKEKTVGGTTRRGAVGAEGGGVWGGGFPLPSGGGIWGGG